MKLLVIGSGGREHAIAWKLAQSPRVQKVYVAPGNAGTALEPGLENVALSALPDLVSSARKENVQLPVVGPEGRLAAGVVDAFGSAGLRIFGPTRAAAQLESSKDFAKSFMLRHGIPTARHASFERAADAKAYVVEHGAPIVIKADGLAGGKGVVVAGTREEAHAAIDMMLTDQRLGAAGSRVVVEEFLEGEEASFIVMSDGAHVLTLATSQDHKRLRDGDAGPNTGGMGAYSPAPVVTPKVHSRVMREIILPAVQGMAKEGMPYTGFLYAGLMIDRAGNPKTLEFNCRLGDPEAQPFRRHAIPQGHRPSGFDKNAITMQAQAVHDYFTQLQARIVAALEALEGAGFRTDRWQRAEGGGGVTRVIEDGRVFERGGVNFSRVQSSRLPPSATAARPQLAGQAYDAMGVSLVLHPRNPYCPTVHMNVRFFSAASAWWFGGGMDLTPYYGFEDDARHFHAACRDALAPFGADYYPRFKRGCDEYFQLRHRGEPRGIGGIFFDDFADRDFDFAFSLTRSVADHFLDAYRPILERRKNLAFGEREREFQAYRRGRYVEFNLVYDRGTLFGSQSGGRAESILVSLPPRAAWRYDWRPEPGSPEVKL